VNATWRSPNASRLDEEVPAAGLGREIMAPKTGVFFFLGKIGPSTAAVQLSNEVRTAIIMPPACRIGTVPVFRRSTSVHGSIEKPRRPDDFLHHHREALPEGVDYQTIHAGLLIEHPAAGEGAAQPALVSPRRRPPAQWMLYHHKQNPAVHAPSMTSSRSFKRYDCQFSLG